LIEMGYNIYMCLFTF